MRILDSNLDPRFARRQAWTMNSGLQTLLALILAPILGGAIAGAALGAFSMLTTIGDHRQSNEFLRGVLGLGYFAGAFGGPGSLLLGWPAYRISLKLRVTNPLAYIVTFALIAAITVAIFPLLMVGKFSAVNPLTALASFSGAIGGLVFWSIRRPDRQVDSFHRERKM